MHPLIQEQIRTIDQYLNDLREAVADQQEILNTRNVEHAELQREQWRQRKHQVTISHMSEDLENTQKTLETYEAERAEVHGTLEDILGALKGLRSAMTGEDSADP